MGAGGEETARLRDRIDQGSNLLRTSKQAAFHSPFAGVLRWAHGPYLKAGTVSFGLRFSVSVLEMHWGEKPLDPPLGSVARPSFCGTCPICMQLPRSPD